MLVIEPTAFARLMEALVAATHGLTGLDGKKHMPRTVDELTLRAAALAAVMTVAGDSIHPGDKPLILPKPRQEAGLVRFAE